MTKSEKEFLDKTYDMFRKHWIETNNVEESWERTKRLLHWYRIGLKDGATEQNNAALEAFCKVCGYKKCAERDVRCTEYKEFEKLIKQ